MDSSTKIVRYSLVIAGNGFVAVSGICGAFVLLVTELPEWVTILSLGIAVGVFVAYPCVIATLLIFGNSRLLLRLLGSCLSLAAMIYLVFICFGAMNEFTAIANHLLGFVMVALLWLGLMQNVFGWKIQSAGRISALRPQGQFDLWILFAWTFGVAILSTVLSSDSATTVTLMGMCFAAILTTSITFAIIALILRRVNFLISVGLLFLLLIISISIGVYFLNHVIIGGIPPWYCEGIVTSSNIGVIAAALFSGISLRLLDYRLVSAPLQGRTSNLQNQEMHESRV